MRSTLSMSASASASASASTPTFSFGNRPAIPSRLTSGNRNVQLILSSLDNIKKIAAHGKVAKLHAKCEELIYFIVR
jgi:hypothetical protein